MSFSDFFSGISSFFATDETGSSAGPSTRPSTESRTSTTTITDIEDIGKYVPDNNNPNMVFGKYEDNFADTPNSPYYKIDDKPRNETNYDEYDIPIPFGIDETDAKKFNNIIDFIIQRFGDFSEEQLDTTDKVEKIYRKLMIEVRKKFKYCPKKNHLFYYYRRYCRELNIPIEEMVSGMFVVKANRSASGVVVFSVFTHPFWKEDKNKGKMKAFSCAYNCFFCPEQPGRARSYVDGESGNDRAVKTNYDIIKQVYYRGDTYNINGHKISNCEVIILGGTFDSYPREYHDEFFRKLYYAFNTINDHYCREILTLEQEIEIAKGYTDFTKTYSAAAAPVIGVTIETRPDQLSWINLKRYRQYGVTRIQLGIQATDDRRLLRVNRGCTTYDNMHGIEAAMRLGFKIDIHIMPGLPHPYKDSFIESNPNVNRMRAADEVTIEYDDIDWDFDVVEADRQMFETIATDPRYNFDQIKIYPLQIVPWSVLYNQYQNGLINLYTNIEEGDDPEQNEYIKMLVKFMTEQITPDKRINRNKRDIPDAYSQHGLTDDHGRNFYDDVISKRGQRSMDIRWNEIGKKTIDPEKVHMRIFVSCAGSIRGDNDLSEEGFKRHCEMVKHAHDNGETINLFIYYTNDEHKVIGFIRLQMDPLSGYFTKYRKNTDDIIYQRLVCPELEHASNIRELHVYGQSSGKLKVNDAKRTHQNYGYGTRLVHAAMILSIYHGYQKMSVIPGFGVENYYRRFGFDNEGNYMTLNTGQLPDELIDILEDAASDPCIQKYFEYVGLETVGDN